ncbi:MAG: hypothetical protein SVW02_03485 [Candidatus Nanohaloarchaea archaeon]|nr:hypothetical protein [Candidatus Nanohaloarchaea archaeon]
MDIRSIWQAVKNRNWPLFRHAFYRQLFRFVPHDGVDVVEEDWDYLLILDACRYDIFKEVNWLDGELQKAESKGSTSIEWLNKNFPGRYDDIVYVTTNPKAHPAGHEGHGEAFDADSVFHDVKHLYLEDDYQEHDATAPEHVTQEAIEAAEEYPDKRIIVHYMQPHGYSWKEIREYYRENLVRVLESVEEFIDAVDGKIIITADHGEGLGDHGIGHHPYGVYLSELVEVPWFEVEERPA